MTSAATVLQLVETLPDGAERLYSEAAGFADAGAVAAPDGGADFRKLVYRAPAGGYVPVAPARATLRLRDGAGRVLLEQAAAFPAIRNPSAGAARGGVLAPVDAAAARGTPFEAAARRHGELPPTVRVEMGATVGTGCTARLTFRRAAEPEWVHCDATTGDVYCYRLARATVWVR